MRENVLERSARLGNDERARRFCINMKQDYAYKKTYAEIRAREFVKMCDEHGKNYHVSVGGLDSITLLFFLRSIGIDAPAVSCSFLEDKSIQEIHKQIGVERISPCLRDDGKPWTKPEILREVGFPVLSKEIAGKIDILQHPTEKNKTVRHAIITGETGSYGGNRKDTRMKLAEKWLHLFGGYENENENVNYSKPNFMVSDKCCYYLKEKPCEDWAKEHNSVPFLGLMASEGGRRAKMLKLNGCNYWGSRTQRSCPFAIFSRQDLLQLALDLNVPVPAIYGTIERGPDGVLYTTKAKRTGCSMCGFGIQLEKRPHRFDLLRERNPKEWDFYMNHVCTDENGQEYGWGRVLDYIGVPWRDEPPMEACKALSFFDDESEE